MSSVAPHRASPVLHRPGLDRLVASVVAGVIAVLYLLIFSGLLSVGRAETGDLGVLGAAGGLFLLLAVALWRFESRVLWIIAVVFQLIVAAMYVGVAPSREPAYEVWGITIRALSLVNVGILVRSLLTVRGGGRSR